MATPDPEQWKPFPDAEESYEVSDLGRVRNRSTGYILKPQKNRRNNQVQVTLYFGYGRQKRFTVARAVLTAFDKACPPGMEACHGPNGFEDNSLSNLEWNTHETNTQRDRDRDGSQVKGERHGNHKLTEDDVREIRRLAAQGWRQPVLAAKYSMSLQAINNIIHRRTWQHVSDGDT